MKRCKLIIEVVEVRGKCSVYKPGDRMTVVMPELIIKETDKVCIHAFTAMQTLLQAMARGISARELGIGERDDEGFVQCPDPGPPYTRGGTVIFRIRRASL